MIYFITWYIIGVVSFIYWWTSEFDLTIPAAFGSLVVGLLGPFAFLLGWTIHGKQISSPVILKKRNRKGGY